MKLIHLSDLHLGKRVNGFSMLEDQSHVLTQILEIIRREQPAAILLAGDIYDKSIPSVEAVRLFDGFLRSMAELCPCVIIISGNHDSAERLGFASDLLERSGVYVTQGYEGHTKPVTLTDEFGPVDFFPLPFFKPVQVRSFFPEAQTYTDAVQAAVSEMQLDPTHRSVLIAHQFVTGSVSCESEELSVGGTDQVDAAVFEGFDYVALGHLHGPQNVSPRIRYCGSPLKYSFSEEHHEKSVTVVDLTGEGEPIVRTVPLEPLRDFRTIRGTYLALTALDFYRELNREDYYRVILTDEQDIPEAIGRLRAVYPNLMTLSYDNQRTRLSGEVQAAEAVEEKSPEELFALFYEQQNGCPMSEEQTSLIAELIREMEGQL